MSTKFVSPNLSSQPPPHREGSNVGKLCRFSRKSLNPPPLSDREIHAPPPQNRRSTSWVQNWGWWVFCLFLRFRQFAHHPPKNTTRWGRSFVGMVRGSRSPTLLPFPPLGVQKPPNCCVQDVRGYLGFRLFFRRTVLGSSRAPCYQRDLC